MTKQPYENAKDWCMIIACLFTFLGLISLLIGLYFQHMQYKK